MAEVYAVFEGGGVKGIALVAALARASQERKLTFKGYAGASAGAIVAALAAVGYTPQDLEKILAKLNYLEFLEDRETISLETLQRHLKQFQDLFAGENFDGFRRDLTRLWKKKGLRFAWGLWGLWADYRKYLPDLEKLAQVFSWMVEHKGVYQTSHFQKCGVPHEKWTGG